MCQVMAQWKSQGRHCASYLVRLVRAAAQGGCCGGVARHRRRSTCVVCVWVVSLCDAGEAEEGHAGLQLI